MFFIASDEVSTVAVYFFFGTEIHRIRIAHVHLMLVNFARKLPFNLKIT